MSPYEEVKPIPGQMDVYECIQQAGEDNYTVVGTPSGIAIAYSPAPRRHYKIGPYDNNHPVDAQDIVWTECPSVTNVLSVLDKSGALTWWGMKVGVEGFRDLLNDESLLVHWHKASTDDIVALLTERKLTVNHKKDQAADRGLSIHGAFEDWAADQSYRPDPFYFTESERPYVEGLNRFLDDLPDVEGVEAEVMVGSIEHGFAGRYDLRLTLADDPDTRLVSRCYPKRADKWSHFPGGTYLVDLKTSKSVYPTHALQLAAYEMASIECGYGATEYRAVLHVTGDGKYEFVRCNAQPEHFLSVLSTYNVMQGSKAWTGNQTEEKAA